MNLQIAVQLTESRFEQAKQYVRDALDNLDQISRSCANYANYPGFDEWDKINDLVEDLTNKFSKLQEEMLAASPSYTVEESLMEDLVLAGWEE